MALEDVVKYLQHKGNTEEALSLGCTVDGICMCRNASTIQTILESFLSRHRTSLNTLRLPTELSLVEFPCYSSLLIFL